MKNLLIAITSGFTLIACNSNSDKSTTASKDTSVTGNVVDTTTATTNPSTFSIKEIVGNYLELKNALTNDNGKDAATAGKAIVANLNSLDVNVLPADKKQAFLDVATGAKEHATHIGDNAGKLEHQRKHFDMLSQDMNELLKTFDAGQKLYQVFCPMYNNGKGAIWISESKQIRNPYYGSEMLTCGEIKKEL